MQYRTFFSAREEALLPFPGGRNTIVMELAPLFLFIPLKGATFQPAPFPNYFVLLTELGT